MRNVDIETMATVGHFLIPPRQALSLLDEMSCNGRNTVPTPVAGTQTPSYLNPKPKTQAFRLHGFSRGFRAGSLLCNRALNPG